MNDKLIYKVALSKIPYVGINMARRLIQVCGGVKEIFTAPKKLLLSVPRVSEKIAASILETNPYELSKASIAYAEKNNIEILFFTDEKYPYRLKNYTNSPMILYLKGNISLNTDRLVAIVGTRQPSEYGKLMCEQIVEGLQEYGVTIISGLAYGIDAVAHKKCISLQLPTVGVLGNGLGQMYPAQHKKIADQMLQCGGLLSQFEPNQLPKREHFPMRNKIIAGMVDAVVVVETGRKGGSMITAEMANEYNKDVFAVPGRLSDKNSLGCNFLIKSHKAQLIESAEDIAYVMRWGKSEVQEAKQISLFSNLSEEEELILNCIKSKGEIHIDNLIYQTNLKNSKIAAILLELEFKGMIKALPGKMFMMC